MKIGYQKNGKVFYLHLNDDEKDKVNNLVRCSEIKLTYDKDLDYYRVSRETFFILYYLLNNEIDF